MARKGIHEKDAAEAIAVSALNWLASEPEHLGGFLSATGLDPSMLRKVAAEPGFLAGVLDYLMQDETLLLSFCASNGIAPENVVAAHHALTPPFEFS
jgi:hypothetical protein